METTKDKLVYASPLDLCNYISVIKYLALQDEGKLTKEDINIIKNFPGDDKITKQYSLAELRVLYHSVEYIWKKLTGGKVSEELKVKEPNTTKKGCYWVLENGLLLKGDNHVKIIKNYMSLFASMLNVNEFTLIELLNTKNKNKLISFVIKNGAVRMYLKNQDTAYFQLTGKTFDKWARKKLINFNYKKKFYKIIDSSLEYKGWTSGIYIKLIENSKWKIK